MTLSPLARVMYKRTLRAVAECSPTNPRSTEVGLRAQSLTGREIENALESVDSTDKAVGWKNSFAKSYAQLHRKIVDNCSLITTPSSPPIAFEAIDILEQTSFRFFLSRTASSKRSTPSRFNLFLQLSSVRLRFRLPIDRLFLVRFRTSLTIDLALIMRSS